MSVEVLGILAVSAKLVEKILESRESAKKSRHTSKAVSSSGRSRTSFTVSDVVRDRIEETKLRSAKSDTKAILEKVEERIEASKDFSAFSYAKAEYDECVAELKQLQSETDKTSTYQKAQKTKQRARRLLEKTENTLKKAAREAERVAAVKVSLEVFDQMGFSTDVQVSSDEKFVTIIATGGEGSFGEEKEILVQIDEENRINADFTGGYAGFASGECGEDAYEFFSRLQELGVELREIQTTPKAPTHRGGDSVALNAVTNTKEERVF